MHTLVVRAALGAAALSCAIGTAAGQVMIADSGSDRVSLFNSFDGSIIDLDWLTDIGAVGWAFSTPKEAVVVGGELWVADQVTDAIHRFSMGSHSFLGSVTTGVGGVTLDNLRSLGTDGSSRVWLTTDGGSVTNTVTTYDFSGNALSSFVVAATSSPFDAEMWNGNLLVTDSDTNSVREHMLDGTFVGDFATGLAFAEQLVVLADNSVVVANAIDSNGIEGVWHYNADGSVRAYLDTNLVGAPGGTVRGANVLGNGNYIIASSTGVWTAEDIGGGVFSYTLITDAVDGQYITFIPAPGSALALLGLGVLAARRRR